VASDGTVAALAEIVAEQRETIRQLAADDRAHREQVRDLEARLAACGSTIDHLKCAVDRHKEDAVKIGHDRDAKARALGGWTRGGRATATPRSEVLEFADDMERKLRENDHKGGWDGDEPKALLKRLREEVDELAKALASPNRQNDRVIDEAADVGNFAMMIADVIRREGG
jgi:NTP pyrophosphatase (non-canonical NTP hydrolase)/uncharacterized coiled-coil protein SlyX